MTPSTAMMMTITITMTLLMIPRIYYAWLRSVIFSVEEEREKLRLLQVEENVWVMRQIGYGLFLLTVLLLLKNYKPLEVSSGVTGALALYAMVSLLFAIVESVLAQKISDIIDSIPVPAKGGRKGIQLRKKY